MLFSDAKTEVEARMPVSMMSDFMSHLLYSNVLSQWEKQELPITAATLGAAFKSPIA